jgi:hypothetical protein
MFRLLFDVLAPIVLYYGLRAAGAGVYPRFDRRDAAPPRLELALTRSVRLGEPAAEFAVRLRPLDCESARSPGRVRVPCRPSPG